MAAARRQFPEEEEIRSGTVLYIDGNTVRRTEVVPEERPQEQEQKKQGVSYQVRLNRERARHMSLPYVMMLTVAMAVTVVLCCQMLQISSHTAQTKKRIAALQSSVDALRMSNNAIEDGVRIYTDLDYVYRVATKDLGMVYPTEEQVIRYNRTESEYVRQYEDIPEE